MRFSARATKRSGVISQVAAYLFFFCSILGTQHITNGQNPLLTHERVLEIASDISLQSSFSCPVDDRVVSPAIVILSWGLNRGINVIPRSNREENIKTLGQLITRGPVELTEKHMKILGGLGRFS